MPCHIHYTALSSIIPAHCCLYVVNVYNICFLYLCYTPYGVLSFENKLLSLPLAKCPSKSGHTIFEHTFSDNHSNMNVLVDETLTVPLGQDT